MIDDATAFALAPDVRYRVIDGEVVIVRQKTGEVLGLNGTGSSAFELAARGKSVAEIVQLLADDLDVERDVLAEDMQTFFAGLVASEILALVPGGPP